MKISKIYANKSFKNVSFNETGLNVIIGKISDRENTDLDSHNIGKSLLLEVIDFLLLKKVSNKDKYFLTKYQIFEECVFFAEIKLNSGQYLIVRRATATNTKISFKINDFKLDDFITDFEGWDEENIAIDKARKLLNTYINYDILPSWTYRKAINYFMRYQNDYIDVFKLSKFQGVHKDWKPMVFDLLGFDGKLIDEKLSLEEEFEEQKALLKTLETENKVSSEDEDKVVGLIEIKQNEFDTLSDEVDKFNFYEKDNAEKEKLINDIESQIKYANTEHYNIKYEINKIENSLTTGIDLINIDDINELYKEVEIFFPDALLEEYEKVVNFNKEITSERNQYLSENLATLKQELIEVETQLKKLENEKSVIFTDITEKTTYDKFKKYQKELAKAEADIIILQNKLTSINKMSSIQEKINRLDADIKLKVAELKKEILKQKHKHIRKLFNEFTMKVLNTPAILSVKPNKSNNIEFEAEYQNQEELITTDLARGNTYKKILCAAFDTALLQFYSQNSFYKFVYHDGVLDSLDIRKKEKYIEYVREMANQNNIQYILTVIESETYDLRSEYKFTEDEVRLLLSDESCGEKLFEHCF
ncbi:DUF2326 domain-containing protein [Aliarcobacter cryaerophilus]|uniref:DUF2326 domain-containing protein n=1 Tax=Aliarcobacter TaxID=2321111 RepID=UPI0021B31CFD|nr:MULTISPECIES: DUF2326 domain-containing protein [Aliarcobacter]MCT7464550.1 DUF2326 domain-containing protein [Aliarcobacter cryaerophilus]MCT7497874.1 DUF2326 domain-containing protein [Aliarcobacter cryaerophilus]MDX4070947.1 DUF2326 domain-containing protein [Aliarcobacter skirrowii]